MEFSEQQIHDFGVALNEADLVGVDVDPGRRVASLTFAVLALPEDDGAPPGDPRVQLVVHPVGRLAASLRHGNWDDAGARVETFGLERLAKVVASFEQQPVYGWEFLDVPAARDFESWSDRLSLDWRSEPGGMSHTLDLFQESGAGAVRHLDLRLWFDELRVLGPEGREITLADFTAAGIRWWDGLYAGDPRTTGHGIVAGAGE